tara:strand:+ start:1398 stop:2078 length:681 start_codon:yes stop_codon:yes gene_type:complete
MSNNRAFDAMNNATKDMDIFRGDIDQLYNQLLSTASHRSGVSPSDIEKAMDMIAYHESKGKVDSKQELGGGAIGRGRGLFQYEISHNGKQGAGRSAMNRLYHYMGGSLASGVEPSNLPDWMLAYFPRNPNTKRRDATLVDVDFSNLSAKQQKILFMADKLMAKHDSFEGISTNHKELSKWWLKNHNKTAGSEVPKRLASFKRDMDDYPDDKVNKEMGIIPDTSKRY